MNKRYYIIIIVAVMAVLILIKVLSQKSDYAAFTEKRAMRGNLESSIVIEEWSDFECPACGEAYALIEKIFEQYQGKVKFVYRHFPLPYHRYAYQAAVASECAQDQGKFWDYYNQLFQNQKNLTNNDLKKYADLAGFDQELFNDCLDSEVKEKVVDDDLQEAKRLNLSFTPSIFINGQLVEDWQKLPEVLQLLADPASAAADQPSATSTSK